MPSSKKIICIGEVLWDSLPTGLFLGGAPLNVCYHLNKLGLEADMCSRVGNDRLGHEALRRIKEKGISAEHIQVDMERETGFVEVEMNADGEPSYDIIEPVAWDFIESNKLLKRAIEESWGIVFGSLAQRHKISRTTIQRLCEYDIKKVVDLNLRAPYVQKEVAHDSLKAADIVKMNLQELEKIKTWFAITGDTNQILESIAKTFGCSLICVTQGAEGAIVYKDNQVYEHEGFTTEAKDAVGAGDAFLAAFLQGIIDEKDMQETLTFANALGAYMTSIAGGTPEYSPGDINTQY